MRKVFVFSVLLTVLIFNLGFSQDIKIATINRQQDNSPEFVGYSPNAIVVKFDKSTLAAISKSELASGRTGIFLLDQLGERFNVKKITQRFPNAEERTYRGRDINLKGWHKFRFAGEVDVEDVVGRYKSVPGVQDAQPIGIHKIYKNPNDSKYGDQWHLNQSNDHDIDAPEAWDVETGNDGIIVAILDTGVRYFHKDLGGADASYSDPSNIDGNVWINWAEKNGVDGVDDDGNGFVDDWVGWDFVDGETVYPGEDGNTPDNDPRDFNGHGTHCAGNVAALNNNGYATASPAGGWGNGSLQSDGNGVKIMALRMGWSWGRSFYEVGFVGMDYAADAFVYAADNGANIASCSWGSSNSGGLGDAVDYFLSKGGMVFHAAGNGSADDPDYLDNRGDCISVASTDQNDIKSDFSNFGTWVDISAPGSDIMSTYHDHNDPENDYVASLSGTSMATPLSAGVAALIWSKNPSWSAGQVEQQLYDSADDIDGLNSDYAGKLGAGRVNAYNAVNTGGGTPPPVAAFSGSPTSGCAPLTVSFTDESTGEITSWSWNFGDGGTSAEQNPSHQFTSAGVFTVSLTVTGSGGSDTETKNDYISVSTAPVAAFTGSPTSGTSPLTVNFTDQSTNTPTSWSWDFGDGGTSTAQNPSYQYVSAGTYTVSLTATNDCGSDTDTKTDYITVTEPSCDSPVAAFTGSPTSGTSPLTVNFTDQSTNTPTSWSWDFGDGGTSTAQNPSYQYTSAGTYTVSLTATNDCGSDTDTKTDYITVTEPVNNVMHVQTVSVIMESFYRWSRGKATVHIVDANNNPVADATVSGQWSGDASDSDQFQTNSDGSGSTYSNWKRNGASFTFCVTDVTKSGWTYDESANDQTCGSTDGSASVSKLSANDVNFIELQKQTGDNIHFNYPNPFNPGTTISFLIPSFSHVSLEIYNVLGKKVATLMNEKSAAGFRTVYWDARDSNGMEVGAGYYFYRVIVDNQLLYFQKILYLK